MCTRHDLVTLIIAFLVASLSLSCRGDEPKNRPEPETKCKIDKLIPAAQLIQKGYSVEYQSGTGKECMIYRVRNTTRGVLTPFLWKDKEEILLEANVPKCPKEGCQWITATKIYGWGTAVDKTDIAYGLNKDECHDKGDAYVEQRGKTPAKDKEPDNKGKEKRADTSKLPPLTTTIRGAVAARGDGTLYINLVAISTVSRDGDSYRLLYEFRIGEPSKVEIKGENEAEPKDITPVFLAIENEPAIKEPRVVWPCVESKPYVELVKKLDRRLTEEKKRAVIEVRARDFSERKGPLAIMVEDSRLIVTTARAYVPKD